MDADFQTILYRPCKMYILLLQQLRYAYLDFKMEWKEHDVSKTYKSHVCVLVWLQGSTLRRCNSLTYWNFFCDWSGHSEEQMVKWMSDEFKGFNYEGDKYLPVVKGSTSAIFRHGMYALATFFCRNFLNSYNALWEELSVYVSFFVFSQIVVAY